MDELLVEVGVTRTSLDKTCTDEHLQDVALFLESWSNVAPYLGLSSDDVEVIQRDVHNEQGRRRKVLEVWKGKFAFKAKYRVLVEALLKIGRADQAERVCHLLAPAQIKGRCLLHLLCILHLLCTCDVHLNLHLSQQSA